MVDKATTKKATPKKKPIGFEMMKSFQKKIEKSFAKIQKEWDDCSVEINDYIYDGKKKNAPIIRTRLMDITKESKILRTIIQEAKDKLKPIYKS